MSNIGIFLPGVNGDLATATSVLRYTNDLWPNHNIIWFCNHPFSDILKYNDKISEIRSWPNGWEGNKERSQIGQNCDLWEDWSVLKDTNNHLDQRLKNNFDLTKDIDIGYFPAPWQMSLEQRHNIDYPNCSRKIFGVPDNWEWRPYLCFSNEERDMVEDWRAALPYTRTIMLETYLSSGPRYMSDDMIKKSIRLCNRKFGQCNFIFASHIDHSNLYDDKGMLSCSHFTVRQTALVNNYSDLIISIGSGISVVVSCWGNKQTPHIQYTGSFIGSTVSLGCGIIPVYHDPPAIDPEEAFYHKLKELLNSIN